MGYSTLAVPALNFFSELVVITLEITCNITTIILVELLSVIYTVDRPRHPADYFILIGSC